MLDLITSALSNISTLFPLLGLMLLFFISGAFRDTDSSTTFNFDPGTDPSRPNDDYGVFSQDYWDPYLDPWGHGPND